MGLRASGGRRVERRTMRRFRLHFGLVCNSIARSDCLRGTADRDDCQTERIVLAYRLSRIGRRDGWQAVRAIRPALSILSLANVHASHRPKAPEAGSVAIRGVVCRLCYSDWPMQGCAVKGNREAAGRAEFGAFPRLGGFICLGFLGFSCRVLLKVE